LKEYLQAAKDVSLLVLKWCMRLLLSLLLVALLVDILFAKSTFRFMVNLVSGSMKKLI